MLVDKFKSTLIDITKENQKISLLEKQIILIRKILNDILEE